MADPMDVMTTERSVASQAVVTGNMPRVARNIFPAEPTVDVPVPVVDPDGNPAVAGDQFIPEPVVEVVPTPVAPKEFIVTEEWQAQDEAGKPVGPPSKIFGRGTTEIAAYKDLANNLKQANIQAARKIKEYRDKYRTYDQEKATLSFEPQTLTAEDRIKIARLLADPATVEEGYAMLYQSQFGESPEQVRKRKAEEAEERNISSQKQETDRFLLEHPDFPASAGSRQLVVKELNDRKEAAEKEGKTFGWTAHNLEIIYDDLVEKGLLVPHQLTSQKVPEPVPVSQIAPTERVSQEITPQVATPATPQATAANTSEASGNTRPRGTRHSVMSTEHGQAAPITRQAEDEAFRKEVNDMPLSTLKSRIKNDKGFAAKLNSLSR